MSKRKLDHERIWKIIRPLPNVNSVSGVLQPKIKGGKVLKTVKAIRIYVEKKVPLSALADNERIPEKINGHRTDVVAIGEIKALSFRPAKSGMSAIFRGGTACTIGWFARDLVDTRLVIISNNHCTCDENKLTAGHPYLCPSPTDGGTHPDDLLGTLKRCVPIQFETYQCPARSALGLRNWYRTYMRDVGSVQRVWNKVDLGVISAPVQDWIPEIKQIGQVHNKGRGNIGDLYHKYGRTTHYTKDGVLIDNDWYGEVGYSRGKANFGPCMLIEKNNFSAGGDSSSALLRQSDNMFSGLLFAGSDTHTIGCHWDLIESEGNLEIYTS